MKRNPIYRSFLQANWLWIVSIVTVNALSGFARTEGAAYLGRITDLIESGRFGNLWRVVAVGSAVMTSAYALRFVGAALCLYLTQNLALDTRLTILRKMKRMDFACFERHRAGDLQSIYRNDVQFGADLLYIVFSRILNNVFLFGFSVWYMLSIDARLTFVVAGGVVVMGALNQRILRRLKGYQAEAVEALGEMTGTVESCFSGVDTVKSYGAKAYVIDTFRRRRNRYNWSIMSKVKVDVGRLTIYNLANMTAILGSTLFLGFKALAGEITVGQVMVYVYLVKQILVPVEVVFRWMSNVVSSNASWDRIHRILDQPDEEEWEPTRSATAEWVAVTNISFAYDNTDAILNELGIQMKKGEILNLAGKSGSGKTTLLKILLGLYRTPQAVTSVNGEPAESLSGLVAYGSSEDKLFPLSLFENIALGNPTVTRADCLEMVRRLGFGDWVATLPDGIESIVGEKELSGGQRQMISNARALLSDHPIVILDEPNSALDETRIVLLRQELDRQKRERMILVTSHRSGTAESCDGVLAL